MNMVIKRDGRKTEFDPSKISRAILRAMKSCGIIRTDIANSIAERAIDLFDGSENVKIEDIENYVYFALIEESQEFTAKTYEGYRAVREHKRSINTTDTTVLDLIAFNNEEVMNENSNKNAKLNSTQRDLIAGEISKDLARRKIIPAHIVQAHDEGIIHWHDMDYTISPMFNCCLINLEDMLTNGTVINDKLVEEPKSFTTACTVTTQIMAQVSSNQYGGQSITIAHIAKYLKVSEEKAYIHYLEKGLDKEKAKELSLCDREKELKAGVQTIRYQLSTLMTTNGQAPFATIYLEIIPGHKYEKEMADICEEMLKQRIEGMKNYKGQTIGEAFPKLVYVLDEHNCLEGGKYDYITKLSAKCNVRRLVPDYQSAKIMRQNYEGNNFPPINIIVA